QQRGLAAAAGAHQHDELAPPDGQTHVLEHLQVAELLAREGMAHAFDAHVRGGGRRRERYAARSVCVFTCHGIASFSASTTASNTSVPIIAMSRIAAKARLVSAWPFA